MDDISFRKDPTVRIGWKLPARLRKPVAKTSKKKKRSPKKAAAAGGFTRTPISTPSVWKAEQAQPSNRQGIVLPSHRFFHHAQPHTGDIADREFASLSLAPPPYRGGAAKLLKKKKPVRRRRAAVAKAPVVRASAAVRKAKAPKALRVTPSRRHRARKPKIVYQERDVAYHFSEQQEREIREIAHHEAAIVQPKASFTLSVSRYQVVGALFLLISCGVSAFLLWNLQGAGRGWAILATIETKAARAFDHVTRAQAALANTDTEESREQFAAASQELASARADLDAALSTSKNILRLLDLTGTVKSSQDILDVGALLADAGVYMSEAIEPFLAADLDTSLTDAIIAARPKLGDAQGAIDEASEKLAGMNTSFMPEDIASEIDKLKTSIPGIRDTLHHITRESGTLLTLLGADRDRQYLMLFANNDELRPVGGFIGTVGLINVERGKVENIDVRSVYDGDGQLKKFLAPPNPLLPIVDRWYLRDSNWFVDYRTSARKAAELFEKEGGPTVDGVIMMTPAVIQNLLRATGPIAVPGYNVEVTHENFVQVTQGEVTYHYDREENKPKQFLADLTPLLLTRLFSDTPGEAGAKGKLATLQAITASLLQKDMLLYFRNEEAQRQALELGWSGALPEDAQGFLMVNNANIGGHKSDQFIEQEIDYRTTILESGDADVVLTVRRTHHGPEESIDYPYPPGENPALKDNIVYQRTLVPKGAQLLEAKGFTPESEVPRPLLANGDVQLEADADIAAWQQGQYRLPNGTVMGKESGYDFFANWVMTPPGQTTVTLYHYRIPGAVRMPGLFDNASSYALSIAKQPGQKRTTIRASIDIPSNMAIATQFPASGVTMESDTSFVYRGQLTSDIVPGIVFHKR